MDEGGQEVLSSSKRSGGRLRRLLRGDLRRVFLLALLVAFGLQWQSCIEPNRMHSDWREVPHWRTPSTQEFHPDDPLIRYQRFEAPAFGNVLYGALSRTGIDAGWGKINGTLWFACTAVLLFLTARAMAPGRWAGWAAALTFVLFPSQQWLFVGGFPRALAIPLLCLSVLLAHGGRWWWSVLLVTLQSLVHPTVALQSGLLLLLVALRRPRSLFERSARGKQLVPLVLVVLVCLAVIGFKFLGAESEFGRLVTRVEIGDKVEFTRAGPMSLVPTPSVLEYLSFFLVSAFYLATCALAFLVLGKRMLALPRGLYALLVASLAMLCVADVLALRLGHPGVYAAMGLPLFGALTVGVWVGRVLDRENRMRTVLERPLLELRASPAVLGLVVLGLIGLYEHGGSFVPAGNLETRHYRHTKLYDAVRSLPGGIMLAAHPRTASELPLMTGRSVVISSVAAHPWWTEHWTWSTDRIYDVLRAYYADDPEELLRVTRKYGIDYWVVDRTRYTSENVGYGDMLYEPFKSWAQQNLRLDGYSVLRVVPRQYQLWNDNKNFFIVSSAGLEKYVEELRRQGFRAPAGRPQ